ncbi:MAG: hypothetical protein VB934_10745, partial [Polyangiaceae bacterium]
MTAIRHPRSPQTRQRKPLRTRMLVALPCALLGGCANEVIIDLGHSSASGGAAPTVGSSSVGGSGGSGGTGPGPCAVDCNLLAAPPCQVSQCNLNSGQCAFVNTANGLSCSDDLFCTVNDRCSQGECVGGPLNDCGLPLPACQVATCDEDTNSCTTVPIPNGTPCVNTMIACVQNTVCAAGQCVAGAPISQCINADSCCPSGCLPSNDSDCGATTVRAAVNRGWWSSAGTHAANNNNTFTGRLNNLDHNAYFS